MLGVLVPVALGFGGVVRLGSRLQFGFWVPRPVASVSLSMLTQLVGCNSMMDSRVSAHLARAAGLEHCQRDSIGMPLERSKNDIPSAPYTLESPQ